MDKHYEHMGAVNGWIKRPTKVVQCEQDGHKVKEERLGDCYYEYTCDICNIKYTVDSSD
jgi:hypothetical protein